MQRWKGGWGRLRLLFTCVSDYMAIDILYPDATALTVRDGNNPRGLVSGTSQIVVLLTPTDPEVIFLVHFEEAK